MHGIYRDYIGERGSLGLIALRLVAGIGLMLHGWPKIQNAFSWMGPHATVPGIFQALSAVAEFGGGLALILGLLTTIASFGIICNMATALFMVHLPKGDPFIAAPGQHGGSYESALSYLAIAFLFMMIGPGAYSLDARLFRKKRNFVNAERHHRVKVSA